MYGPYLLFLFQIVTTTKDINTKICIHSTFALKKSIRIYIYKGLSESLVLTQLERRRKILQPPVNL